MYGDETIAANDLHPSHMDGTNFGDVVIDSISPTRAFTITNIGSGSLNITAVSVRQSPDSSVDWFAALTSDLPVILAKGQQVTLIVGLETDSPGSSTTSTISIQSNSITNPNFQFAVAASLGTAKILCNQIMQISQVLPLVELEISPPDYQLIQLSACSSDGNISAVVRRVEDGVIMHQQNNTCNRFLQDSLISFALPAAIYQVELLIVDADAPSNGTFDFHIATVCSCTLFASDAKRSSPLTSSIVFVPPHGFAMALNLTTELRPPVMHSIVMSLGGNAAGSCGSFQLFLVSSSGSNSSSSLNDTYQLCVDVVNCEQNSPHSTPVCSPNYLVIDQSYTVWIAFVSDRQNSSSHMIDMAVNGDSVIRTTLISEPMRASNGDSLFAVSLMPAHGPAQDVPFVGSISAVRVWDFTGAFLDTSWAADGIVSYGFSQNVDNKYSASFNSISLTGNTWIAVPLPNSMLPASGTVLEFEVNLINPCEMHAITPVQSVQFQEQNFNFWITGTEMPSTWTNLSTIIPFNNTNFQFYRIPIGYLIPRTSPITHIGFISDCDLRSISPPHCNFRNVRIYNDEHAPSITISSGSLTHLDFSNANPIIFTISISQSLTNFSLSAIERTNCDGTKLIGKSSPWGTDAGQLYTIACSACDGCNVSVLISKTSVASAAGVLLTSDALFTVRSDILAPSVAIVSQSKISGDLTSQNPITFTFTPSETSDFSRASYRTSNCRNMVFNDTTLQVSCTAIHGEKIEVIVDRLRFRDLAGNPNDQDFDYFLYSDLQAPIITVSSPTILIGATATNVNPISFTLAGNEITSIDLSLLQSSGCYSICRLNSDVACEDSLKNRWLTTLGTDFRIECWGQNGDVINVQLPLGSIRDLAGNSAAPINLTVTFDVSAPTLEIWTAQNVSSGKAYNLPYITFNFRLSEPSGDFTINDINSTNCDGAILQGMGVNYSLNCSGGYNISIVVPSRTFHDGAGNWNLASSTFWLLFDATSPFASVSSSFASNSSCSVTNNLTISFSKSVIDFNLDDLVIVDNGTGVVISHFTSVGQQSYLLSVTNITQDGSYSVA
jgi:hypothetical protein